MRKNQTLVLGVVISFLLSAVIVFPPQASALPPNSVETYYYSDDTYSEQVGYRYLGCDGFRYSEGVRTSYSVAYAEPCGSGAGCVECVSNGVTVTCPGWVCFMYGNCC